MRKPLSTQRLDYLDAARGLAALMVLFGHYINWKHPDYLSRQLASVVFNANDAVSFFFVLSGMVLSYPYLQFNKQLDIGKFYVARVFRIYPGFWVALIICALYAKRAELNGAGLERLFLRNDYKFWEEAFLIKGFSNFYVPGWTLAIEMVYSFLMPFLVIIAKHNRKLLPWLLMASLLMSYATGTFLFHFVLGTILTVYFQEISATSFKTSVWYRYRYLIITAAILLFSIRQLTRISPLGPALMYLLDFLKLDFFIFTGLASFVFIACFIHFPKAQRFLSHPILVFYGKISYGIYLMHWVFVWAVGDYWESRLIPAFGGSEKLTFVVMGLVIFIGATVTATLLHYFVELPFMKWGKRITRKMKPTISV